MKNKYEIKREHTECINIVDVDINQYGMYK